MLQVFALDILLVTDGKKELRGEMGGEVVVGVDAVVETGACRRALGLPVRPLSVCGFKDGRRTRCRIPIGHGDLADAKPIAFFRFWAWHVRINRVSSRD